MSVAVSRTAPAGDAGAALAVSIHDLHVRLGGSHVLQGVSFDVPSGGVTALLGRNGVGKTTTLRAVLGLVAAEGAVSILGTDVSAWPTHRIIRLGVAYVPEDRDVFGRLTVAENLKLAELSGRPHYEEVFALFPELGRRLRQRAGTLSGGQQQMLSLARAMLNGRRLFIIDEPTKGLAPRLVGEVAEVLERAAELSTVLLVEQNVSVVRRLAKRFVVLDHGEVVHEGDASALGDEDLVRRLLGVSGP